MNSPYRAALVRGIVLTVVAFGGGFLSTLQQGGSMASALIVGGSAALPVLAVRFGGEGTIDNNSQIQRDADSAKGGN